MIDPVVKNTFIHVQWPEQQEDVRPSLQRCGSWPGPISKAEDMPQLRSEPCKSQRAASVPATRSHQVPDQTKVRRPRNARHLSKKERDKKKQRQALAGDMTRKEERDCGAAALDKPADRLNTDISRSSECCQTCLEVKDQHHPDDVVRGSLQVGEAGTASHGKAQVEVMTKAETDFHIAPCGVDPSLKNNIPNAEHLESVSMSSEITKIITIAMPRFLLSSLCSILFIGGLQFLARAAVPTAMSIYAHRHFGAVAAGSPVAHLQSFAASNLSGTHVFGFGITGAVIAHVRPCICRSPHKRLVLLAFLIVILMVPASILQAKRSVCLGWYSETCLDLQVGDYPGKAKPESHVVPSRSLPELNQLFQKTFRSNPVWSVYRHTGGLTFQAFIKMPDCESVEGEWEATESKAKQSALERALRHG